jgi:hypothetical protein
MKLYHGTSFENYQKIIVEGFGAYKTIWNCSDTDYTYVWNLSKIRKGEGVDWTTAKNFAFKEAFSSARLSAAVTKSLADKVIVFELDIPSSLVSDDDSCDNMGYASKVESDCITNKHIKRVYYQEYSPLLALVDIRSQVDNPLIDLYDFFTPYEVDIITALSKVELYVDYEIYEQEYFIYYPSS